VSAAECQHTLATSDANDEPAFGEHDADRPALRPCRRRNGRRSQQSKQSYDNRSPALATIVAHRILRMNPIIVCGALAGAMTVDAAITGCCERADSQTPVLGVAVPYAVGNVLLTILGPVIVTLTYAG
jgi:hypothetical protein